MIGEQQALIFQFAQRRKHRAQELRTIKICRSPAVLQVHLSPTGAAQAILALP